MLSEYSGKEVPLVPGTLRGYRTWTTPSVSLHATNVPYIWHPGINQAVCHRRFMGTTINGPHPAPLSNCTCGFYACYHPDLAPYPATGVVEMSGRVILGTRGMRAEKARIVAHLAMWDEFAPLREKLYPEVKWFGDTQDMLAEFPPQDVSELIGSPKPVSADLETFTTYNLYGQTVYLMPRSDHNP